MFWVSRRLSFVVLPSGSTAALIEMGMQSQGQHGAPAAIVQQPLLDLDHLVTLHNDYLITRGLIKGNVPVTLQAKVPFDNPMGYTIIASYIYAPIERKSDGRPCQR